MTLEKSTGHDWLVFYSDEGDPVISMSVFGQMTAEKALEEARFSLGDDGGYEIVGIIRHDQAQLLRT